LKTNDLQAESETQADIEWEEANININDHQTTPEPHKVSPPPPRYNCYGYRYKQQQNKMLTGDNLALFLNSDPAIVDKYRRAYQLSAAVDSTSDGGGPSVTMEEDGSLRGLGNAVLSSRIYRVKSATRCKALRRRQQARRKPPSSGIDCESEGEEERLADSTLVAPFLPAIFEM
jgi:hypothetical protein